MHVKMRITRSQNGWVPCRIEANNFDRLIFSLKMRFCLFTHFRVISIMIQVTEQPPGGVSSMTIDQKWKGFVDVDSLHHGLRQQRYLQFFLALDRRPKGASVPTLNNRINQKFRPIDALAVDAFSRVPNLGDKRHAVEDRYLSGASVQGANRVQVFKAVNALQGNRLTFAFR